MDQRKMSAQERAILCKAKYSALDEMRYLFSRYLDPQRHYAYLRSKGILSFDDQERIQNSCVTTSERAEKFLDVILRKGPNAFDELYNSIKLERTQPFLLQEMNKKFEDHITKQQLSTVLNNVSLTDEDLPGPDIQTHEAMQSQAEDPSSSTA